MNWPVLPFSKEAISLCLQMMALYWSVRWLSFIEKNMLAALAAMLLVLFNVAMIGWHTSDWLRVFTRG